MDLTTSACQGTNKCDGCPGRVVCRCLQITEEALVTAIQVLELKTVKDVRTTIGAGDGCTCCHKRLQQYLEKAQAQPQPASLSPICS